MKKYIDADLYKEELSSRQNRPDAQHLSFYVGVQLAKDLVDRAPEVELAPVIHAHWTNKRTQLHDGEYYCSHCEIDAPWLSDDGAQAIFNLYCHRCGAKMDEEVETDE